MKTTFLFKTFFMALAVSAFLFTACQKEPDEIIPGSGDAESGSLVKAGNNGAASYVVVLNDDFEAAGELSGKKGYDQRKQVMSGYLNRFLKGQGVGSEQLDQVYTNVFMGFSARLSGPQAEKLRLDPRVKSIEPDHVVDLGKPAPKPVPQPAEVTPAGITRVGGGETYTGPNKAWIIDTGIDLTHPDLKVNTALSKTFVLRTKSANDDNGHGTHVAGTIAAIDNTIGVVGVAAGATVVAVKVLDKSGSGSYSVIISGVDYVAANAVSGDVANMSLGGPVYTALDNAVLALAGQGVKVALAAGNSAADANTFSPARVNHANIYTVSAMDVNDVWAYFSNYGNPPVDYCAPGVSIRSCYKGGGYATMSGTSMASPHVAGLLLWGPIKTDGTVVGDPDGDADPIAHK